MNVIKEINQINQKELENGSVNTSASWHAKYAKSAWVYVGNLPTQLTEGDILSVMSQFGEIEDINLVREESNGKSKGFSFVKYEDARSCILAVDNFNGSKILQRSMRVDHVENYRLPKHLREKEEELAEMTENGALEAGHMYKGKELENNYDISRGHDLFASAEDLKKEEMEQRRREKEARKKEREVKRQEKAERKERREEKRRLKRARKLEKEEKSSKKHKADKKKHRRKRYDSDDDNESGSE